MDFQQRVINLVNRVKVGHYPELTGFRVTQGDFPSDFALINVVARRVCSVTKKHEVQHGRRWIVEAGWTDEAILGTMLKAVLTFEEHEIRERFTLDGKPIYNPHH